MMKIVQFRSRRDKLAMAGRILSHYKPDSILDLGCDTRELNHFLRCHRYVGLDISGSPDVVVDLNLGLPFRDRTFDMVIAFDVLEHLQDIHFVFDEMLRVSSKYVVVGLPNMYEWHFRVLFLVGKRLSGKYGLAPDKPMDRHTWVFSLREARAFVNERAIRGGFEVADEILGYFRYDNAVARFVTAVGQRLGWAGANVFAYSYWATLSRRSS